MTERDVRNAQTLVRAILRDMRSYQRADVHCLDERYDDASLRAVASKLSSQSVDEQIDAMLIDVDAAASKGDALSMEKLASGVARLVKNATTLFDIKTVIVQRALKFVISSHDKKSARALRDTLSVVHGIHTDETKPEDHIAPAAVGAEAPIG